MSPDTASQIPLSYFVANDTFSDAVLSPNARYLAVRFGGDNDRDRLAVVDLVNNKVKVVGQIRHLDVTNFQWVNNERLIFDTSDKIAEPGKSRGSGGLFAVNRDGSLARSLGEVGGLMGQVGPQDSDIVYLHHADSYKGELKFVGLHTLDTMSGKTKAIPRAGATREWMLDTKGLPRVNTTLDDNKLSLHYLDPDTEK